VNRILIYRDRGGINGAEQINHSLAIGFNQAGYVTTVAQPEADNALVKDRMTRGIGHYWLPDDDIYDWRHPAQSLTCPAVTENCLRAVCPGLVLFADSFPFANLAAKRTAAAMNIPYLVLVHCVQPDWAEQYQGYPSRLPGVYAPAAEVVAVSLENLELLRREFSLPQTNGRLILNGRPDDFFIPHSEHIMRRVRASLDIAPDHIVSLSIGRMHPGKGWKYQLDALTTLPRCEHWQRMRFIWVGSGHIQTRIRRFAGLLAPGRIRMLPEANDIPALLDAADLMVHPAEFEGMTLVVLEAMAKGLPVIASEVSGYPEALGESGLLLPPPKQTPRFGQRLAAAICELAGDSEQRRMLGRRAHARALEQFTEARMARDWLGLVQSVTASGR